MTKLKQGLMIGVVTVVIVVAGGAGFYYYGQYQQTQRLLKDPAAAAQEEIDLLVYKVGRHIQLPEEETPTVATVSDTSKLVNQPFFTRAESGDKVLVYSQAGKAILFRPEIDKIIEVAAINLQPSNSGTGSAVVQQETATLAIYNSTSISGLASVAERSIAAKSDKYETTAKLNSKTDNYEKTLVVVLKPEAAELGNRLAEITGGAVTTEMPQGEDKPEADLMLILGTDYQP